MTLRRDGTWELGDQRWECWTLFDPGHPADGASIVVKPGDDLNEKAAAKKREFENA